MSAKLPKMRERVHQPYNYGSPFFDNTVHAAVMAHAECQLTTVLPTDQTIVYMSLKTAKAFGLKAHPRPRRCAGRMRGKMFPRWKWVTDSLGHAELLTVMGCASVGLLEDDGHSDLGIVLSARWWGVVRIHSPEEAMCSRAGWARRCDAKRWCERMLATGGKR